MSLGDVTMGREYKRKQAKKDGKPIEKVEKKNVNPYEDIYKLLKTLGIIVLIILLIYLAVGILITKEIDWFSKEENTNTVETKENAILAKNTFRQVEESYYVYFYDFDNENSDIETYLLNYISTSYTIYRVDIKNALNSNFVKDEANMSSSIDEFSVNDVSLIKIENELITSYYLTEEEIINYFMNN